MTKTNAGDIVPKLYQLLAPLTAEERTRVIQATLLLFGDDIPSTVVASASGTPHRQSTAEIASPVAFFQHKNPLNKGETLAVAARYREQHESAETHSKEELRKVISDARRNFDNRNFPRDIKNARRQAGFFNLNTTRDANQLSYYGQQYVDAMPDRTAAEKLNKPKTGRGTKKGAKAKRS